VRGEILQLKEAINSMVDQLRSFASASYARWHAKWGTDGKSWRSGGLLVVAGTWKDLTGLRQRHGRKPHAQVRNIMPK